MRIRIRNAIRNWGLCLTPNVSFPLIIFIKLKFNCNVISKGKPFPLVLRRALVLTLFSEWFTWYPLFYTFHLAVAVGCSLRSLYPTDPPHIHISFMYCWECSRDSWVFLEILPQYEVQELWPPSDSRPSFCLQCLTPDPCLLDFSPSILRMLNPNVFLLTNVE